MIKNTIAIGVCILALGMYACSNNSGSADSENSTTTSTAANKQEGEWKDLTSKENWKNYNKNGIASQWENQDGMLVLTGKGGGDIITKEQYKNFELELDWKISEGGNSGLFFNVVESDTLGAVYHSGPEYQLLDDERHPDAKIRKHRSGDNYDVQQSTVETVKPAGEWNHTRLLVNDGHVEHYLNGEKVVEYELGSQAWQDSVANSKFTQWPAYGKAEKGHIALQDHGDKVWFKNIRIRKL